MIRVILLYLFLFFIIGGGMSAWAILTKNEKWTFTKILVRGIIISAVVLAVMFGIVILF